ncbi:MAG: SOS response-associated peptidase [Actinomycetota bacterium]|nr:SOS response-associated peptidase [Actinomycetota bacterium]
MCGRYAASRDTAELVEQLDIELDATREPSRSLLVHPQSPPPNTPDWNMAPTKQAPVVLTRAPRGTSSDEGAAPVRQLRLLTWGLVPSWAKDVKAGLRMINARVESVLEKPAFKRAAVARRCLVPAQGWYEWQVSPVATDAKGKPRKQPFFMHRLDGDVVALAGLYEFWRDPQVASDTDPEAWLTTFTIVTTAAEPGLDRIHDRQPLVLERDDWARWLDPGTTDVDTVSRLLLPDEPRRPGRFDAYPVSSAVSATRNNGEQLLLPLPREELHGAVDPVTGEVVGA